MSLTSANGMIELRSISYAYPDKTVALENLSLNIRRGEKIAVLGSNGAGKSTLFLILNGVYRITGGEIYFQGRKISYNKSDLLMMRQNTGIVFQDPETQIFSASVYEEISFGLENLGFDQGEIKTRVDEILRLLNITHIKDKPTHLLSYGEKKKVSIADILVMNPEVLIMDEPDACLDPAAVKNLVRLLDDLHAAGKTIVLSTQDVNLAYSWAERILVMKDGKLLKDASPPEVFADARVIGEASLELPLVFEMANTLKIQNHFPGEKAIQKNDLIDFIKKKL